MRVCQDGLPWKDSYSKAFWINYVVQSLNEVMTILEDLCEHFREILFQLMSYSEPAITCSKLTIETPEQGVKYVQSQQ